MTHDYYIGLMSGTSLDGVDIAVVSFVPNLQSIAQTTVAYPEEIYHTLQNLSEQQNIATIATLDQQLGQFFATTVNQLCKDFGIDKKQVVAIGLHGQTIDHDPEGCFPYTVQIGDANQVAYHTDITTVADFRRKDMAAGGQGAPLAPAFHQAVFADKPKNRVVLNIGGIANVTYLPKQGKVIGFDTGPGNGLLDAWVQIHQQKPYDVAGAWAASGQVNPTLLAQLLAEPYFKRVAPKSTGREFFNLGWLSSFGVVSLKPVDVQATLSALTVQTIVESLQDFAVDEVLVCGGGLKNTDLIQKLQQALGEVPVFSTTRFGLDPDMVEAIAFAWLAKQTMENKPGNLPSVTGASKQVVLGAIYQP